MKNGFPWLGQGEGGWLPRLEVGSCWEPISKVQTGQRDCDSAGMKISYLSLKMPCRTIAFQIFGSPTFFLRKTDCIDHPIQRDACVENFPYPLKKKVKLQHFLIYSFQLWQNPVCNPLIVFFFLYLKKFQLQTYNASHCRRFSPTPKWTIMERDAKDWKTIQLKMWQTSQCQKRERENINYNWHARIRPRKKGPRRIMRQFLFPKGSRQRFQGATLIKPLNQARHRSLENSCCCLTCYEVQKYL